jgi:hypothetical protein
LHHLLLEQRYAQGAFGCGADFLAGIFDRFFAGAPAQVGVNHPALDQTSSDDGDLNDQVVEAGWLQAREHGHLRTALDLEDAHHVGALNYLVGQRVLSCLHFFRERCALEEGEVRPAVQLSIGRRIVVARHTV